MIKNKFMQLCLDNAAQHIKNQTHATITVAENADENTSTVFIYDVIGGYWGIQPGEFAQALLEIKSENIDLRVNCPGGDVFAARAMKTALERHPANITAMIDGVAASAATWLCSAAKTVEMSEGAMYMIHRGMTVTAGNSKQHAETIDFLNIIDQSIINDYHKKTGLDESQLESWLDAETWFTAAEAKEHKFIDLIFDPAASVENKNLNTFNLSAYEKPPQKDPVQEPPQEPTDTTDNQTPDSPEATEKKIEKYRRIARSMLMTEPV